LTRVSVFCCCFEQGFIGFYKGITASYFGITETAINFVLYECIKSNLARLRQRTDDTNAPKSPGNESIDFVIAGAISKTVACCLAYPHEVARTRLREENTRFHGFFQTLHTVYREEGYRGLYRGLGTQLVRQIPNMAIMMTTYEATVYLLDNYFGNGVKMDRPIGVVETGEQSHNDES